MSFDHRDQTKAWMMALIDKGRLRDVLELLAEVCHEKGGRLRSESKDEAEADYWESLGTRILCSRYAPIFR